MGTSHLPEMGRQAAGVSPLEVVAATLGWFGTAAGSCLLSGAVSSSCWNFLPVVCASVLSSCWNFVPAVWASVLTNGRHVCDGWLRSKACGLAPVW